MQWKADPGGVHILDVRTFEEYIFVGHFEFAKNIPLVFPRFDPAGPSMPGRPPGCSGELNAAFVSTAQSLRPTDHLRHVRDRRPWRDGGETCSPRRGSPTSTTSSTASKATGSTIPGSVFHGKHMRNGWKNEGLPWGYEFHPDLMWVSSDR